MKEANLKPNQNEKRKNTTHKIHGNFFLSFIQMRRNKQKKGENNEKKHVMNGGCFLLLYAQSVIVHGKCAIYLINLLQVIACFENVLDDERYFEIIEQCSKLMTIPTTK